MAKGRPSGSKMRAKYAKYRNIMKKRAMQAKKKGTLPSAGQQGAAEMEAGIPLETDDDVSFSEERYDDETGKGVPFLEQWDDEEWDEEWDGEEIPDDFEDDGLSEVEKKESDEEIISFLKKKYMGGEK